MYTSLLSTRTVRDGHQPDAPEREFHFSPSGVQYGYDRLGDKAQFASATLLVTDLPPVPNADAYARIYISPVGYIRDSGCGMIRLHLYPDWREHAYFPSYRVAALLRCLLPGCEVIYDISTEWFASPREALAAVEYKLLHVTTSHRERGGPGTATRCAAVAQAISLTVQGLVPAATPILVPYYYSSHSDNVRNRRYSTAAA